MAAFSKTATAFKTAIAILFLATAFSNVAIAENESTREDFEAFVEAFQGRWIGEVMWVTDTSIGKRGDAVTAYFEGAVTNNGKTYHGRFYGGEGSGSWSVFYNAADRQIQSIWLNSAGQVLRGVVSRDGDNWVLKREGSDGGGKKTIADQMIKVSDDGDTHTWTGKIIVGGELGDPIHDVWRRVAK